MLKDLVFYAGLFLINESPGTTFAWAGFKADRTGQYRFHVFNTRDSWQLSITLNPDAE